jgi:DNA-binding NarL/FixJ family response regulator
MNMARTIRVLLADDHKILREGLRALLEQQADIQVVAEVDNGRDAVLQTRELVPDVVIMDIGMPDLNGILSTREIKDAQPGIQVLCLSVHRETHLVNSMLEAGASGYLVKTSAAQELIEAVRTVDSGQTYLSPAIARDFVTHHVGGREDGATSTYASLTKREREILKLIAEGHHTSEIAGRLHISSKTVLAHRQKIMDKLGLDSTVALARYALREGIVGL